MLWQADAGEDGAVLSHVGSSTWSFGCPLGEEVLAARPGPARLPLGSSLLGISSSSPCRWLR